VVEPLQLFGRAIDYCIVTPLSYLGKGIKLGFTNYAWPATRTFFTNVVDPTARAFVTQVVQPTARGSYQYVILPLYRGLKWTIITYPYAITQPTFSWSSKNVWKFFGYHGLSRSNYTADIIGGGLFLKNNHIQTVATVFMKNVTPFAIFVKNADSRGCICRLVIDQKEMGKFMMDPRSQFSIKRPVAEDKQFVFVADEPVQIQLPNDSQCRVDVYFIPLTSKEEKRRQLLNQPRPPPQQPQVPPKDPQMPPAGLQEPQLPPAGLQEAPPGEPAPAAKAILGEKSNQVVTGSVVCYGDERQTTLLSFNLVARTNPWKII